MNLYDIIIIGTGAGGGTLAHKLADSGQKILILERGDFIPREKENWDTEEVFLKGRYKAKQSWLDKNGEVFHPGIHYCVGGNTKVYGAALLRMREADFTELQHYGGVSPAWPISYQQLSKYYLEAEYLYNVHGQRGSDFTEPNEDTPYPFSELPHEERIAELERDLQALGLKPFPLPIGLNRKKNKLEAPYVLDRFDGFPDPAEMKGDAHVNCIKKIVDLPNVTLKTKTFVDRLETNSTGDRIASVVAIENGKKVIYKGLTVAVCCGAVNSSALLLRSKNKHHPRGLSNSSDLVGRNYMAHNNSALMAISTKPNDTRFGKTLALNDYYFGDEEFKFPMGHIQMLGKSDSAMYKEDAPFFAPKLTLEYIAKHSIDFWMTSEDLPNPNNRVTIDEQNRIHLHYTENNLEGHQRLYKKLKWILEHIGCEHHLFPNNAYLGKKIPLAGTAHQCGTIRFGNNPQTSVLNNMCRSHEIENLYVVDGSFFPSSSAVNPALTIMAMALRVGEFLKTEVFGEVVIK